MKPDPQTTRNESGFNTFMDKEGNFQVPGTARTIPDPQTTRTTRTTEYWADALRDSMTTDDPHQVKWTIKTFEVIEELRRQEFIAGLREALKQFKEFGYV